MSFRFAYSGLFWKTPDLERELPAVRQHGFAGWEMRLPLDWVGPPERVRRICSRAGVEVAAVCGPNVALDLEHPNQQINKRRIRFSGGLTCSLRKCSKSLVQFLAFGKQFVARVLIGDRAEQNESHILASLLS